MQRSALVVLFFAVVFSVSVLSFSGAVAEEISSDAMPSDEVAATESAESAAPEVYVAKETPVTAPAPALGQEFFQADGFIAPEDWVTDGVIISDKEKKLMISEGDTVYVNLGVDQVQPGMQCMVFRRIKKMHDPETGNTLGIEVIYVGRLEISENVGSASSTAKVIASREPIESGDLVQIIQ